MNRLVQYRNWLLGLAVLIVLCAIPVAGHLTFDQTIESFFPPDNPDIQLLLQSRRDFGGDEFVIVAWREPELLRINPDGDYHELDPVAADRIRRLSDLLGEVPGVDKSRTRDLNRFLGKTPRNRNTRRAMLRLFDGLLIGPDEKTTAIILQLFPASESPVERGETVRMIRKVAGEFDSGVSVAGEAIQIHDMFDLVERDGNLLYLASLGVLSAILLIIFRNIRWVLASVGIVIISVVCTRAVLVLSGAQLSMVSSMLNSLVTIISIGTTTHIIVYYRELRSLHSAEESAVRTLKELWHPVFWTMVTIAVGFAALLVSRIVPVRSFAIMMTLGTLMVIAVTLAILPAVFASGRDVPIPGRVALEDKLDAALSRMAFAIDRHPVTTTLICLVLVVITGPGLLVMQVETDFSRNFRETSSIVRALRFVESELGPAGTWEVAFDVPSPITNEFLDQSLTLTRKLRDLSGDDFQIEVMSLNDAIDVPPRLGPPVRRFDQILRRQPDLVSSFYNPERRRMRIILRSSEQQTTDRKLVQIQKVRELIQSFFRNNGHNQRDDQGDDRQSAGGDIIVGDRSAGDSADAHGNAADLASAGQSPGEAATANSPVASGLFVIMAHIIESLLADQWRSFGCACLGTTICMAIAFRSLRIGLISLVPNVFPIALVTGGLGLLNIPVNIGTAMIASVSMGFTCSVHYIAAFENALPSLGLSEALRVAQEGVGKAVVLAHIALVAGFMVLTVSEFIPLVYFGAILSVSMVGGLVSDLVLLPLLLRWTSTESPLPIQKPDQRGE